MEISSKAETDEKTKAEQKPEEAPSASNLDPGLTSPVTEVASEAIKGAADAIKGAAEERGSVSSTTGSTRQMGHTTGQVSSNFTISCRGCVIPSNISIRGIRNTREV